jgi:hypothetical protein
MKRMRRKLAAFKSHNSYIVYEFANDKLGGSSTQLQEFLSQKLFLAKS